MNKIEITVYGNPVPQGRPRFARVGKFVRTYDPKESVAWKDSVKLQAISILRDNYPEWQLIKGAISLNCQFALMRPPSVSVKKRPLPTVKPDLDNLLKAVKDALKGIVWVDDSQVTTVTANKIYSEQPGVVIRVEYQ
jgi:Holliday junction resolvase RusA-like endonuclease